MKKRLKVAGVFCVAAAMGLPAMAQDDGAHIYKAKCQECHGADGQSHTFKGKLSGAAVLTDAKVVQTPDSELVDAVTNGKKHMPAFGKKLTADEIKTVVAYVRTLSAPTAKPN